MFFPGTHPQKRTDNMKTAGTPKGFSLVEVIIVMALITILGSFAIPAWRHYTLNTNIKTATREIMADILNTRQRAIAENINFYQITFDVNNNNYSLSRTDTGVTLWTKSLTSYGAGNALNSVNLGGNSFVNFQRRGTMTSGTITLKNNLNSTSTITVAITGRVYAQYSMQK